MTDATPEPKPTDESAARWVEANDPEGYTQAENSPKDWYLDTLLDFFLGDKDDEDEGAIGFIVTSASTVVSGIAISRKAYIERSVQMLRKSGSREGIAEAVETLWRFGANQTIDEANRRQEAGLPARARSYIHMRDARVWAPEGSNCVPLWRGTLAHVTGGRLVATTRPEQQTRISAPRVRRPSDAELGS